jgi:hypothetical protein
MREDLRLCERIRRVCVRNRPKVSQALALPTQQAGPQSGMTMKMHVDAQRVGECTGKDD